MFFIILLYALLASTFTIGKLALTYVSPILFIGLRMTIAGSILLFFIWFKKNTIRIEKNDKKYFIYIILFHIYFAYVFEFIALQSMNSAKACLFYNFSPFITATLSYLLYSERFDLRKVFGLTIGFLGILTLIFSKSTGSAELIGCLDISKPEILMIVSVCSCSYGWIIFKNLITKKYSPLLINGIGMFFGGLLSLITSLCLEGMPIISHPKNTLFYTLLLIFIANIVCYNMYGYLLHSYSATFLSFAGFLTPLFAAFFGWLFLSETISYYFFISLLLITFGLIIFYSSEKKLLLIKKGTNY